MQKYGLQANLAEGARKEFTCLVCGTKNPTYSWTDFSGEGYCTACGTPYQLKWGELREGESYPRINIKKEAIPLLREFWNETHLLNPLGSIMIWSDYPEKERNLKAWHEFSEKVKHKYPELFKKETALDDNKVI